MFREGGEPQYGQMKLDARLIDTPKRALSACGEARACRAAACGTSFSDDDRWRWRTPASAASPHRPISGA